MMLPRIQDRRIQLQLFEAEKESDLTLQQSMNREADRIARMLAGRRLPMFYFVEAGEEIGVNSKTVRKWRMNAAPLPQGRGGDEILYKTTILMRVYLRLRECPEGETYQDAMARLLARINGLLEQGFTRNQVAQQMRMSFRTLKDLREKGGLDDREPSSTRKPHHCPWHLLGRLERAEEEIRRQAQRQAENEDLRIPSKAQDYGRYQDEPELPPPNNAIGIGDPCRKCEAGWPNLREDGEDGWNRPVMVCMICGTENALALDLEDLDDTDQHPPGEEEFIERYGPCRNCQAYWNHLKRERIDRWNNSVYICVRCAATNRVRPKRTPAAAR